MYSEKNIFEKKESEPSHNVVMVDFLRHGSTEYQENFITDEEKKAMNGKYPTDLTPQGEKEVGKTFEKIISKINPRTDIVVLWSSPAWRAQGSEYIFKKMLEEKNIEIYNDSTINLMRNFDQKDKEFMSNFWESLAPIGKTAELAYACDPEFQEKNSKFESQPEVKKRAEKVFNWIRYLAKHANLQGKRLRIIGVSHFEFLNPIIEDLFGTKIEKGEGINKGEEISMKFDYDFNTKEIKISANFRGENKSNISFDEKNRHFIIEE